MAFPQPVLPARSGIVLSPDRADDPEVFPYLRGGQFPQKTVDWSTTVRYSKSGRRFAKPNQSFPIWRFKLSYASLSEAATRRDLWRLLDFFNAHAGQASTWFYYDPSDNVVEGQPLGFADGIATEFQLTRSLRTWSEPVMALNGAPTIFVNGSAVPISQFSVAGGIVIFNNPPAAGSVISWTGSFLFNCAFSQDDLSAQQMNELLWSNDGLEFESVKGYRVA